MYYQLISIVEDSFGKFNLKQLIVALSDRKTKLLPLNECFFQ